MNKTKNYEACFAFFLNPIFKINLPNGKGKSFKVAHTIKI